MREHKVPNTRETNSNDHDWGWKWKPNYKGMEFATKRTLGCNLELQEQGDAIRTVGTRQLNSNPQQGNRTQRGEQTRMEHKIPEEGV